ncbi:unnamed protein product [Trifolium pratense]|uniref:Uncharacterized protein n=1 Tax=Trifolium pratense TaxID=57577 RepID=A0ACB0LAC5_TRIPR|nr:unnamed protein product [Trifolium pratense]
MDLDIMASIHSANHLSTLQYAPLHSDDYSVIHYTDVNDDGQYDFRCPFCDFDIQVPVFCSDFEDVVCPVCEENLGKDAMTQFTHSSSRKWGWKSEKSSIWSGNSAMFGKKLGARGNKQESIPDPLLSPFICNVPVLNSNSNYPDENSDENSSCSNKDIEIDNAKRCMTDVGEQDQQERGLRATFVQKLILSTIFEEIV